MTFDQNQALAALIAQSRQQQQLSREALSGLAGVSVSFIRDAERDPSSCSFGKLYLLCSALGMDWQLRQNTLRVWPESAIAMIESSAGPLTLIGLTTPKAES